MNIRLSLHRLIFVALLVSISSQAVSQTQKRSREDGDLIFNDFLTGWDQGVEKVENGGVLQLRALQKDTVLSSLNWKLEGLRWQYNNGRFGPAESGYLRHAVDVDDISSIWGESVLLITDQVSNKVIAYSYDSDAVVWDYSAPNANYSSPSDAFFYQETVDGRQLRYILITWKASNVVSKITLGKSIVWQFGRVSTAGIGEGLLNSPSDAVKILGSNEVLIADTGNKRVIIVDETKPVNEDPIVWEYSGPDNRFSPVDVEYVADEILGDHILITDQTAHRVLLVNRNDQSVTWAFGDGTAGSDSAHLRNPSDADWNPTTRRVIIADKGNNRIIEVSPENAEFYYEWPNPVYSVDDVDFYGSDSLLACQFFSEPNVWIPVELSFAAEEKIFVSNVIDLGQDVDFETLTFNGLNLNNERVRLQFRSSAQFPNQGLSWRGPDGTPTSYYNSIDSVLFSEHKVHRYFQIRAFLTSEDPRLTPVVERVRVSYQYFDTSKQPHIYSRISSLYPIGASPTASEPVYVSWDTLRLNWRPSEEERFYLNNLQFWVSLADADFPDRTLLNLGPLQVTFEPTIIPLGQYTELFGTPRLHMVIRLITYNSSLTPRLDKWRISWRETVIQPPSLAFTDRDGMPKPFYTAARYIPSTTDSIFADKAYVQLLNIMEPGNSFDINVTSNLSLDSETLTVKRDTINLLYSAPTGILLKVVAGPQSVKAFNDTLEVFDRDVLAASFTSSLRPTETLAASIPVIEGVLGELSILNQAGTAISRAELNQRVFARVTNERDRSIDLVAQDSIQVRFFNPSTNDSEVLTLYEEPGNDGQYGTGIFSSQNGIVLRNALNYSQGDYMLYARPNDDIQVIYYDNFKKAEFPTRRFITVADTALVIQSTKPLYCQVAPNPFYASGPHPFRMRIGSSTGALSIKTLEIFNLAGEKVAEIPGETVRFDDWGSNTVPMGQYGHINNWWSLQTDSGLPAASGTYWVKVKAEATTQSGAVEQLSALVKFVIIR